MTFIRSKQRAILIISVCVLMIISLFPLSTLLVASERQQNLISCGEHCTSVDIVVIGSELQGILLAKAARDLGRSVLVLDPRGKPGGELIQGEMQFLDEPHDKKKRSLVQGEMKRLFDGYKSGKIRSTADFQKYYDQLLKGIPIHNNITISSVHSVPNKEDQTLQSITYRLKNDLTLYTVKSSYFVENTDFNALTSKLDVRRIPGMESLGIDQDTPDYMSATMMLKFKKVDWNKLHQSSVKEYPLSHLQEKYGKNTYVDWNIATGYGKVMSQYKPKDSQLLLRGINALNQKNGQVIINALLTYDVDPSDEASVRNAIQKAKAEAPFILEFLRKKMPGFEKAELNGFPDYLYIRDYNRFETDYILNDSDIRSSRMFWDNVSIGGYAMDLQGTKKIPSGIGFGVPDRYGMPLRSFMLKGYENVIVVGKNVGATIKAYGSARIMANNGLAAETIGIILGREFKSHRLKQLTPQDFTRIHKYLKKDYHISV
ncbi:FAD-dependent oxidoreductase [Cohnella mopanensis]|uniref:FAD-dependent oxidoreductase n=1 Tax=Cohnella mopanensis TaxID=2911966 RepID=UPI001EF931B5|nr:FAD-dependent oxidoreductase [Cohnella mopanensis]